jgi:tRNA guanosine-2'-O-methyltransferase
MHFFAAGCNLCHEDALANIETGKPTSMVVRTWYQWISQAAQDKIALECLHDDSYWDKIRIGLLHGHADQRKYCIGVIRQSLIAAQSDIRTPTMQFRIADRAGYIRAYDQYSALFETVVLDRYPNQVQACLPELTKLMQSEITPLMACTLLSAALNHTVQEGVRKIIGNWYIDYVSKVSVSQLLL